MNDSPFKSLDCNSHRIIDSRGYLEILYEQGDAVLKRSFSLAGVFRGMHWQRPPYSQTKLIRVRSGRVLDFIVNPTETPARLYSRELGPSDGWIQIEAHFAHGFYALENTEFEYLCIGAYNEAAELNFSVLKFLRSSLGLKQLTLSAKDSDAKTLNVVDGGLHVDFKKL